MNKEIHWDLLRGRILVLLISLLISAVLIFYSSLRFNEVNNAYQNDRRKLNEFARNYQSVIQEEKLYKAYVDRFESFMDKGYIGEEHRLLWIEVIQDINRTLKLPVLRYTISPRRMVDLSAVGLEVSDKINLHESTMSLTLGLLHTGDLYEFFDELEQRAQGLFEIRGCDLQRASTIQSSNPNQANINATCLLSWYTIELVDVTEVALQ